MLLPDNFEDEISNRFYDKEIIILDSGKYIGADGGVSRRNPTEKSRFFGNVRFNKLGVIENEIGLTLDADITITCSKTVEIESDDTVEYLGKRYSVVDILPSDSHLTITGKECQ